MNEFDYKSVELVFNLVIEIAALKLVHFTILITGQRVNFCVNIWISGTVAEFSKNHTLKS